MESMMQFLMTMLLVSLIIWVISIIGMWKAFEKAGQPGWACIIPYVNIYFMTKIGGKPGWWLVLVLIPIVNLVILIWIINMVSKSFGRGVGFTLGLIFLGFIFWPILGFSDIKYQGPYGDPAQYKAYQDKMNGFDFEKK